MGDPKLVERPTPEQLAELERLEREATPGPVVMWGGQGWPRAWNVVADADVVWPVAHRDTPTDAEPFAVFLRPEDQRHYATMRNALPSLIHALTAASARADALGAALLALYEVVDDNRNHIDDRSTRRDVDDALKAAESALDAAKVPR